VDLGDEAGQRLFLWHEIQGLWVLRSLAQPQQLPLVEPRPSRRFGGLFCLIGAWTGSYRRFQGFPGPLYPPLRRLGSLEHSSLGCHPLPLHCSLTQCPTTASRPNGQTRVSLSSVTAALKRHILTRTHGSLERRRRESFSPDAPPMQCVWRWN
jgi:hypothetical protein